jgi:nucleoside 2-deoxyribosyltransferase
MNIYFACSITGGRDDEQAYQSIVGALVSDGHVVPTASLADPKVLGFEKVIAPVDVYQRDVAWIEGCDLLVAEVSTPSHGVGFEISYALSIGKHVFCLHREEVRVSKMITGNTHPNIRVWAYASIEQAIESLRTKIHERIEAAK